MAETLRNRAGLAVGAVDRALELTSQRIAIAKTYAEAGKADAARFAYRVALREAKTLATRLRSVDTALKSHRALVPPGERFKVVK